jgi:hypothetical protein
MGRHDRANAAEKNQSDRWWNDLNDIELLGCACTNRVTKKGHREEVGLLYRQKCEPQMALYQAKPSNARSPTPVNAGDTHPNQFSLSSLIVAFSELRT